MRTKPKDTRLNKWEKYERQKKKMIQERERQNPDEYQKNIQEIIDKLRI